MSNKLAVNPDMVTANVHILWVDNKEYCVRLPSGGPKLYISRQDLTPLTELHLDGNPFKCRIPRQWAMAHGFIKEW